MIHELSLIFTMSRLPHLQQLMLDAARDARREGDFQEAIEDVLVAETYGRNNVVTEALVVAVLEALCSLRLTFLDEPQTNRLIRRLKSRSPFGELDSLRSAINPFLLRHLLRRIEDGRPDVSEPPFDAGANALAKTITVHLGSWRYSPTVAVVGRVGRPLLVPVVALVVVFLFNPAISALLVRSIELSILTLLRYLGR